MCDFSPSSPTNGEIIIKTEEILIKQEQLTCNECDYTTICPDNLEQHTQTHIEERYTCDVCPFKTKHAVFLIRHMKKHTGSEKYKCDMCNYTSAQESDLNTHLTLHKVYHQCTECSFRCVQLSDFELHAATHSKPPECYNNALSNDVTTEEKFKYKEYVCDVCNVTCFGKLDFYAHLKTHCVGEPFSCNLCDYMTIQRHDLKKHNSEVHFAHRYRIRRLFTCPFCNYKTRGGNGPRHLRLHTKERPWACKKCDYRSITKEHLIRHMRRSHLHLFKCNFCEYKTASSINLNRHVKTLNIHYFKCIVCNHKTLRKYALKIHTITIHNTPLRKYKKVYINLKTCRSKLNAKSVKTLSRYMMLHGKSFQHYRQKRHQKTLNERLEDNAEKKYICIICAFKCYYKYQLRNHIMMKHYKVKSYACSLCGFRSSTKRGYQRHVALHEADTAIPTPCGICEYNAQNKYDLKYHMKTHKKDDFFKCDFCDFRCVTKSRLVEHISTNHVKLEDETN